MLCYCICFYSYGRVYAADPYNHTLTPAATYSVGAMVRLSRLPHIYSVFLALVTYHIIKMFLQNTC